MAKPKEAAPAVAPTEFALSLDEWCSRQSATDRRVETLGAFHSVETLAGRTRDLPSAFAARLDAFANQPA